MTFIIDEEWAGRPVLSFLKSKLKISSGALAALKRDEMGITVNGSHVTVRHVLQCGECLSINEADPVAEVNETIEPVDIPLCVIFENDDVMVIDKPANMPTHPSHNHHYDTVANAVAHIYKQRGIPLVFRPMGRLDRNTSGIVILAKNPISASFLSYARRNKLIEKKYIAFLCGRVLSDGSMQTIETYMKRTDSSVIMRTVSDGDDEDSFIAVTRWRLLYASDELSVVEAYPQTGRTHQLRVHFAHIGHPILGDELYGEISPYIDRHALHATSLSIPMPYCENDVTQFNSPIPLDMQNAFKLITHQDINDIDALHISKEKDTQ